MRKDLPSAAVPTGTRTTVPHAGFPSANTPHPTRHGLARFIPLAIFLAIVGSVASGAYEAFQRGDRLGAFVPLVFIIIIASGWWHSMHRSRKR